MENQSNMSCSDNIPDVEEDLIKEEIFLSNPSLRPSLEIVEIEIKNIGEADKKNKYQESIPRVDDFNLKESHIIFLIILIFIISLYPFHFELNYIPQF